MTNYSIIARLECRTHELKVWPAYYGPLASGEKTFEVRLDDRGFQRGDRLKLSEYLPKGSSFGPWGYTGQECWREITYVLTGGQFGIEPGYVVLGLQALAQDTGGK